MLDKDTKILILGARGMLARDLVNIFCGYNIILWDIEDIDITDKNQVDLKIGELRPDIIINCAAYTAVDDCEKEVDKATLINGIAVGYLAEAAKRNNGILVQLSTDYVFDGKNKNGYIEHSQEFWPQSVYGASKLLGEKALARLDNYYLIRTSWLYGKNGKNFVDTITKLAKEKKELKVINDQFGKPTYTVDLAKQILYILNNDLPFGIYHITNETRKGGITWYNFAKKICKLQKLKVRIKPCSTKEYPLPAKRPSHSALINTKLPKMRKWQKALKECIKNK
ncbi:dTDP-4-dehydrorhamnose reductase [Candidatus Falkowbacteria bacterium]|nr:dTDP-4-dehydrorhamnose reductase [Candidatus Falkowbacteria bacterium]